MATRTPARAGSFYPASEPECRRMAEACLSSAKLANAPAGIVLGGVAPHAGWAYSGSTAAALVRALREHGDGASTFVIFGAVHAWGVAGAAIQANGAWETPLGEVPVNGPLAAAILSAAKGLVTDDESAHEGEHSIEVHLPLLQAAFGGISIVPIGAPPEGAPVDVGRAVGKVLSGWKEPVAVIGSTDLTHYGSSFYGWAPHGAGAEAHRWVVEENDRRIIDLMLRLSAEKAVAEARHSRSACGAGAVAATIAACREMGATGATLLAQTTSYESSGERGEPSDFVGYAAVSFERRA